MKKRYFAFIFILVLTLLVFTGCNKNCKKDNEGGGDKHPALVNVYSLELSQTEITLKLSEVSTYDFKALFTLKLNGTQIEISNELITSNVSSNIGEYTFNVTIEDQSKTLKVIVVSDPVEVTVTALKQNISLKDTEVKNYDFKSLFSILVNNESIEVLDSYLNLTNTEFIIGSNTLICSYNGSSAQVNVEVIETVYEIELSVSEITINQSLAKSYDYKSLFILKIDGIISPITPDMIENNVEETVGTYTYIVKINNIQKVLTVNITDDHAIEIVKSYQEVEIPIDEINEFDFTSLFSLYVDGKAYQVTPDMIDTSSLNNATINNTYDVVLTYQDEKTIKTETVKIVLVEADQIIINAKSIVMYPNSEHIDLTTLFTITKGNMSIDVTPDMVTGSIDYENDGINYITIDYQNISKVATVEIRKGVIIETPHSDVITITKGTNQSNYSFVSDFKVIINGIHFDSIPNTYISENNADFTTPGEYTVTLKIPYNDKKLGLSGVKFAYYEKTITYKVVENKYTITLNDDIVTLPMGTESYNVYKNLNVTINNRKQSLTENKDYVDIITCYVKLISNPIDFTNIGLQEVVIEVYVNGPSNQPEVVSYNLVIESDVEIISSDIIAFTGDTIFARDLFIIKNDLEDIEVSNDMITGKIDTFTPGVYYVTINYLGIIAESRVVVYDNAIKGTYYTDMSTIPEKETDEDYTDGSVGDPDYGYYSVKRASNQTKYKELIIDDNGEIVFNGYKVTIIKGIDESTMRIKYYSNEYTLHIENGIITLDPDNSVKLAFNDYKRPFVYFNENIWQIDNKVVINYSSTHVLENTISTYSIDVFNLTSKIDGSNLSYGLKINLVEKTSVDTVYVVTFGEVEFDESFKMETNNASSLTFDDEVYNFVMTTNTIGKVSHTDEARIYAGITFKGTIDGYSAELRADQYQAFSLYVNNQRVFSLSIMDINGLKNGGIDYSSNTLFLYGYEEEIFSYKFIVDPNNKTFEVVERDKYYGKYIGNNMMIFLDGYGSGVINFNTKSYYTTIFTYEVYNNYITINYHNTLPSFSYGTYGKLYIDPLLNVLTVKYLGDSKLEDLKFENQVITDGAIVRINSLKVGQNSDNVAKNELYNNIEIITKDGILDNDAKSACITTNAIKFNTPGFYQFTITLTVSGKEVVSYYAIQIIEAIYKDNPIVGLYDSGVLFDSNSLSIDQYGQVQLVSNGDTYKGMIEIKEDLTFTAKLVNDSGSSVTLTGQSLCSGIIIVQCSGMVSFKDYFTKGTSYVSGTQGVVLHLIVVGTESTYILSNTSSTIGEIVEVTLLNEITPPTAGSIIKINDKNIVVKINKWDDATKGLEIADNYRGTYTKEGSQSIVLDGFGNAVIGSTSGTYVLNKNVVTISTISTTKVFILDNANYTYEEANIQLDESLVKGKVYTATYNFVCSYYVYSADTSFSFGDNGKVTIKSVSPSHDDGEDACEEDLYSPSFASKNGVTGTYTVSGNKITISVNGITFVFTMYDVLEQDTITCTSTTLDSESHGYFAVNTEFTVK